MQDYIFTVENAASAQFCKRLCELLDAYDVYAESTSYGVGENTASRKITLYESLKHHDEAYVRACNVALGEVVEVLTGLVRRNVVPAVYPIASPVFAPIQLRKMLGPTSKHSDNVSPFLLKHTAKTQVAYRVVTIILTLSCTDDKLIFPKQQRSVQLKQGSVVLFPPYWMFEHHTSGGTVPRYSLTTWVNETGTIKEEESVALHVCDD